MTSTNIHWAHSVDLSEWENDELFRKIWKKTDSVSGSFTILNAAKYYEWASRLKQGQVAVEVGVDQGRSATVLLMLSEVKRFRVHLVDNWDSVLIDNYHKVKDYVRRFPLDGRVYIHHMTSVDAAQAIPVDVDLVHIDANHHGQYPAMDLAAWIPKLKSGGVVLCHDYRTTFPGVTDAVDAATEKWDLEDLGSWDSLAIRRKP